jgi:hypothetical protein
MPVSVLLLQDVSRLVDLCRQCIAFENIEDMAACMHAVRTDPEINVVRIKNRLDPAFDSNKSKGYRDVAINMCISSQTTIDLRINSHVCELQLILKSFAALKVRLFCTQSTPKSHLFPWSL